MPTDTPHLVALKPDLCAKPRESFSRLFALLITKPRSDSDEHLLDALLAFDKPPEVVSFTVTFDAPDSIKRSSKP